jgi:hypothetical protein
VATFSGDRRLNPGGQRAAASRTGRAANRTGRAASRGSIRVAAASRGSIRAEQGIDPGQEPPTEAGQSQRPSGIDQERRASVGQDGPRAAAIRDPEQQPGADRNRGADRSRRSDPGSKQKRLIRSKMEVGIRGGRGIQKTRPM